MPCRSLGSHPGGGELRGLAWAGSPGPHPGGKLRGLARGVSRSTPGEGVSRPTPRDVCIPACTEADNPLQQTATAVGGTHPTGIHCITMKLTRER